MEDTSMQNRFLLLGEVARLLRVPPHRIVYLFAVQKIDQVPMIGNRRMFAAADVRRVAEALGVEWDERFEGGRP
jgi:hypothetical protein